MPAKNAATTMMRESEEGKLSLVDAAATGLRSASPDRRQVSTWAAERSNSFGTKFYHRSACQFVADAGLFIGPGPACQGVSLVPRRLPPT